MLKQARVVVICSGGCPSQVEDSLSRGTHFLAAWGATFSPSRAANCPTGDASATAKAEGRAGAQTPWRAPTRRNRLTEEAQCARQIRS